MYKYFPVKIGPNKGSLKDLEILKAFSDGLIFTKLFIYLVVL